MLSPSLPRVTDSPDRARPIVAHQQRAILRHRDAHWAAPHFSVRRHKPSQEILILRPWRAGSDAAGRESLRSLREPPCSRIHARRQKCSPLYSAGNCFPDRTSSPATHCAAATAHPAQSPYPSTPDVSPPAADPDGPDVPPRPAIESALLHMRDVVGNEIVAKRVALVHRAPNSPVCGFTAIPPPALRIP